MGIIMEPIVETAATPVDCPDPIVIGGEISCFAAVEGCIVICDAGGGDCVCDPEDPIWSNSGNPFGPYINVEVFYTESYGGPAAFPFLITGEPGGELCGQPVNWNIQYSNADIENYPPYIQIIDRVIILREARSPATGLTTPMGLGQITFTPTVCGITLDALVFEIIPYYES